MDRASQLGQRILPMLRGWAGRLRAEFPALTVTVSDSGSHGLALECIVPDVAPGLPDLVTLGVSLRTSDGTLMIQSADVVWGYPSGQIEAELLPPQGELTLEHIEEVAERLPELFAALRQAIRRGCPPEP